LGGYAESLPCPCRYLKVGALTTISCLTIEINGQRLTLDPELTATAILDQL
jgi:hypothetical protein